jgi:GNAT superfamily N-acetyltransferase
VPHAHIRPATDRDLPDLVHHLQAADFFRDRLDLQRRGHGVLLIAFRDAVPVGHVYLWLAPAHEYEIRAELPGVPLLNRLAVAKQHRNQGIGTALLTCAEKRLRVSGHDRVALGVGLENGDAIRLYRRRGYRQWRLPPIVARTGGDLGNGGGTGEIEIFTIFVKDLGAGGGSSASHRL